MNVKAYVRLMRWKHSFVLRSAQIIVPIGVLTILGAKGVERHYDSLVVSCPPEMLPGWLRSGPCYYQASFCPDWLRKIIGDKAADSRFLSKREMGQHEWVLNRKPKPRFKPRLRYDCNLCGKQGYSVGPQDVGGP